MWKTPFEESMISVAPLIIHCPDEEDSNELMEILERNGITWAGREAPTKNSRWKDYREETCYWVSNGNLSYENRSYAESGQEEYAGHIKCTFCGEMQDFETADDTEILKFLGT